MRSGESRFFRSVHTYPQAAIGEEAYIPDEELRLRLAKSSEEMEVDFGEERAVTFRRDIEGTKRAVTITIDDIEVTGWEISSRLGMVLTLDGQLGVVSAVLLSEARLNGGVSYLTLWADSVEAVAEEGRGRVSAEWYCRPTVDSAVLENDFGECGNDGDTEIEAISMDQLEEWVESWTRLDWSESAGEA